jgi:hypothetical protein
MKAAQPIGTYPTAEMLTFLKGTEKEADVSTIVLSTLTNLYSSIRLTANRNGFDYAYAYRIQITSSRRPRIIVRVIIELSTLNWECFFTSIAITNRLYSAIADLTAMATTILRLYYPKAASS